MDEWLNMLFDVTNFTLVLTTFRLMQTREDGYRCHLLPCVLHLKYKQTQTTQSAKNRRFTINQ